MLPSHKFSIFFSQDPFALKKKMSGNSKEFLFIWLSLLMGVVIEIKTKKCLKHRNA
jgi:hypothetical protein